MTVRDLDRLVSKTDMNDVSKEALKVVRRAVLSGRCGDAEVGSGAWSIEIDTEFGRAVRMSFSFKRGQ